MQIPPPVRPRPPAGRPRHRSQHAWRIDARNDPEAPQQFAATQVVVLTMQDDPSAARIALRAGALAYVLKQGADHELRDAIRLAASGKRYLSPKLGARLVLETMRPPPDDLSARELQVLRGVALATRTTRSPTSSTYPSGPSNRTA